MKKTITITIMAICLMSLSLAYYPGETITIPNEMGITNLVYTITNNESIVLPLEVTINSSNITITFPGDMTPDNFDIVFIENQTNEVVTTVHTHSSNTKYFDKNVTVYETEYINNTVEVEKTVDKIINKTVEKEEETKKIPKWLAIVISVYFTLMFLVCVYEFYERHKMKVDDE